MALKIRLRQQGRTNRQTYRLVVTDIRNPRDGKYLEMIGWYNPFSNDKQDSSSIVDRIQLLGGQGAQITPNAQALIARIAPDVMKESVRKYASESASWKKVLLSAEQLLKKAAQVSKDGNRHPLPFSRVF